ncbi:MAG: flippase-like domain-containing protein [Nanoarchaeota archaeon]|nr:flippase-like domain-containing protein [Nanoarchaeota archaeon]
MKHKLEIFITVVIMLLAIYVLKNINILETYRLLKEVNMLFFILAFVIYFFILLIWDLSLNYSQNQIFKVKFLPFFLIFYAGCFFNTITPGAAFGGEPIRVYFMHKKYKKSVSKILGVIVGDKFFHIAGFVVFALASLILLILLLPFSWVMRVFLWSVLFLVICFAGFLFVQGIKKIKFNLAHVFKKFYHLKFIKNYFNTEKEFEKSLSQYSDEFFKTVKKLIFSKTNFIIKSPISLIAWGLTVLVSYFLFLSLGVSINFLIVMIVVVAGYVIADLSPIPGGIGLTESTMFLLYSFLGVNPEIALIVAVLERAIYYFYTLLIGGLCTLYLRLTV